MLWFQRGDDRIEPAGVTFREPTALLNYVIVIDRNNDGQKSVDAAFIFDPSALR
jgi:hypothetical protein